MAGQDRSGRERSFGAPATFVDRVRPDGSVVRLGSRPHRKHQKPAAGSTWWAPQARGWWIAILFAVGSLLFALGCYRGRCQEASGSESRSPALWRPTPPS